MILKQETPDILVSDNFKQTNFSIDESSLHIIFDVLRSKVYKNPIGSLCREIASNSRDAQREIGDFTTPTEIEISDGRGDFWFIDGLNIIFRDRGIGLSPDRMDNVYAKYGASTKRVSNDFTGGFGLGAKTPFAYCDAFTVRTIVDKVEYIYSIYIDETKEGKIALLTEQPYEMEGNMTEIIVPLKEEDRRQFERECIRNTHFWEVRPTLINFYENYKPIHPAAMEIKGLAMEVPGDYRIVKKNFTFIESNLNVIIDGIYYPVDEELLGYNMNYDNWAFLFEFKNGDLTVSANREQLQYDKETIQKIKTRVDDLLGVIQLSYDEKFADQPSIFHARMAMLNMKRNDDMFMFLKKNTKFYYTLPTGAQTELTDNCTFEPKTYQIFSVSRTYSDVYRVEKKSINNLYSKEVMEHFDDLYVITAEDAAKQKFKMLTSINRTLINRSKTGKFILFVQYNEAEYKQVRYYSDYTIKAEDDQTAFDNAGIKFKKYWDVVPDKLPAAARQKKETISLKTFYNGQTDKDNYRHDGEHFTLSYNNDKIIDMVYFHVEKENEVSSQTDIQDTLEYVSRYMYKLWPGVKIAVSTKAKEKYFESYMSVQDFLVLHQEEINRNLDREKIGNFLNDAKIYKTLELPDELHKDLEYVISLSNLKEIESYKFRPFLREYCPKFVFSTVDFQDLKKQVQKEYPLIDNVDSYKVNDYVNLVKELKGYKQALGLI